MSAKKPKAKKRTRKTTGASSKASRDALFERLCEKAKRDFERAAHRHPNANTWGFFSHGDASPWIGSWGGDEDSGFLWFGSFKSGLSFIRRTLPFCPPRPPRSNLLPVATQVANIVEKIRSGKVKADTGMARLNKALKGCSKITWSGRLSDLLTGTGEFERRVRGSYHANLVRGSEEGDQSPIRTSEVADFTEYLKWFLRLPCLLGRREPASD